MNNGEELIFVILNASSISGDYYIINGTNCL